MYIYIYIRKKVNLIPTGSKQLSKYVLSVRIGLKKEKLIVKRRKKV